MTENQISMPALGEPSPRRQRASDMETAATTESGSADLARQRLLVRALRRRLHLIVAVTALAASAGLFLASSRATTWSATTVIELLDDTVGASQHTVSPEEFEAERQTLESNQLSAALIAALGARGESLGAVSARADEDSTILTITTTADQPAAAVLAAETVVDVFTEQRITNQIEFFAAEAAELQTRIAEQEVMIAELKVDLDTQEDVNLSSALETRLFQSVDRSQQLQRVLRELESEITLADGRIAVIDRPIAASASRRSQLLTALQAGLLGALLAAGAVLVTASRNRRPTRGAVSRAAGHRCRARIPQAVQAANKLDSGRARRCHARGRSVPLHPHRS
jgi:hypothetical protein